MLVPFWLTTRIWDAGPGRLDADPRQTCVDERLEVAVRVGVVEHRVGRPPTDEAPATPGRQLERVRPLQAERGVVRLDAPAPRRALQVVVGLRVGVDRQHQATTGVLAGVVVGVEESQKFTSSPSW